MYSDNYSSSSSRDFPEKPLKRFRSLSSLSDWTIVNVRECCLLLMAAILVLSATVHIANADDSPQPRLPTVQLDINGTVLSTELAASAQQRYMGLSFRTLLAQDEGMLFIYPAEQKLTFTMRNTLIPLSIAFISKDLVINEIHHMNVGPGQLFHSRKKAQFALEVNQGWFAANNISAGDQIIRK